MRARLLFVVVLGVLPYMIIGCQESQSPVSGGERVLQTASFDVSTPEKIAAALDYCTVSGSGQGNAASTRYGNAIRKYGNGDVAGGRSDALGLLDWEYERADLGKWRCSPDDFEQILSAALTTVGLGAVPVAWDGGLCRGNQTTGCKVVSNDGCSGLLTPNPGTKIYYITFDEIVIDPFASKNPIFNSYPAWADIHVFDINGSEVNPANFTGNPAIVGLVTKGSIPVPEAGLVLGHLESDDHVEILPPATLDLLACGTTADVGPLDRFAALFRVDPLFAGGRGLGGAISSFSPVGPIDPASNTKVGVTPTTTTLTDLQSVTLTATVAGVNGTDATGRVYPAAPISAGDPLDFIVDGSVWEGSFSTDANGQARLTLTCGSDLNFGEHEVAVQYYATDTHAESSTSNPDSPTGAAVVNCATPFNLINFDRDPNGRSLKNGEIVNGTYAPGVAFCRSTGTGLCATGNANVFAVSDPNTGNFGSPPRVVALNAGSSPIQGTVDGWVLASFQSGQSDVCVAVFPTAGGKKNAATGELRAYYSNGSSSSTVGQGKLVCMNKKKQGTATYLIQRVEFSGVNGAAKFDNLRYR